MKSATVELSSVKAELSSALTEIVRLKKKEANHQATLHVAASDGAAASFGAIYSYYPDLNFEKIKARMKCKDVEEANAMCRHFDGLADRFVKMAGLVPDSSSSQVEEGDEEDDDEESSK